MTLTIEGEPCRGDQRSRRLLRSGSCAGRGWFVLADVCKVLEIGNPSQAKTRLSSEDVNTLITNDGNRGNPNRVCVNESGLYDVILDSRKPQAKAFRRWITSEVIPSVRKHGVYMTEEVRQEAIVSPDFLRSIAQTLEQEQRQRTAAEAKVEELTPDADPIGRGHHHQHRCAVCRFKALNILNQPRV